MPKVSIRSFSSFSPREQEVINAALNVRTNAQAPYSHFFVGSAVLTSNNQIFSGCNVERCSYTQTTHTEQNAIDTMIAQSGPVKIEMIVAAAAPEGQDIVLKDGISSGVDSPAYHCGHCRQIIWENCYNDTQVPCVLVAPDGIIYMTTIGQLFPCPLGPKELGIKYT